MNCSIAVLIGDFWQGDSFPEGLVKEIKNKKLDNEFVFCQKREGDLMYYSWSWRNEKINRSIFACYNSFMIDLNEKECLRKIVSDLQYIALGDWKTVLPKAQNYFRTSPKLIPLPILSYEKPAIKKTFPKFDANELSKYTDTNSTAFVSKNISEQDKVNLLPLFVILLIIVVANIVWIFVHISSQEKTQQIIPAGNIERPIHRMPFQEENYLPASPRMETNARKQVEKPVDKKTRTTAPIAESHENSTILQNKRFRTELQEVINEWNKSLPIEVEDGIRWVFTSVQGSFCVLHYIVSYEEHFEVLNENFSEERENIKANIKSADKDMVEFLQALYRNGFGVKVQFRLRNTDRTIVIAIDARELKSIIER